MMNKEEFNLDEETIHQVGLRASTAPINAQSACNARVFEYPHLENVFIMEADLYGNMMPKNYCFLAFYGKHGLIGETLEVETLKNARLEDIKKIVETDRES